MMQQNILNECFPNRLKIVRTAHPDKRKNGKEISFNLTMRFIRFQVFKNSKK